MGDSESKAIEDWFNSEFWVLYPNDLSHGKKGPKTVALKSMLKLKPDEEMRQSIINKMRVLIRFAKTEKRCGKDPDRWPFASTFINQERWTAVEDTAMPSTVIDARKCSVDDCSNPVDVGGKCNGCHDKNNPDQDDWRKWRKEAMIRDGKWIREGESYHDWCMRCKADYLGGSRSNRGMAGNGR